MGVGLIQPGAGGAGTVAVAQAVWFNNVINTGVPLPAEWPLSEAVDYSTSRAPLVDLGSPYAFGLDPFNDPDSGFVAFERGVLQMSVSIYVSHASNTPDASPLADLALIVYQYGKTGESFQVGAARFAVNGGNAGACVTHTRIIDGTSDDWSFYNETQEKNILVGWELRSGNATPAEDLVNPEDFRVYLFEANVFWTPL